MALNSTGKIVALVRGARVLIATCKNVAELDRALDWWRTTEDEKTPGRDLCTRGPNSTNQVSHDADCRDRVVESGVCSSHWTDERNINGKRLRDDERRCCWT